MTILEIIQYPDKRLRRKGHKVTNVKSTRIQTIIAAMLNTLANTKNCAALAATQLNIDNPPNIIVINQPDSEKPLCLINPRITSPKGLFIQEEGCMSIYPEEITAEVKRAIKIKVKALDQNGNHLNFEAEDFLSRCIQHEYDHLKGILYIDHLPKTERLDIEKKISELIKK